MLFTLIRHIPQQPLYDPDNPRGVAALCGVRLGWGERGLTAWEYADDRDARHRTGSQGGYYHICPECEAIEAGGGRPIRMQRFVRHLRWSKASGKYYEYVTGCGVRLGENNVLEEPWQRSERLKRPDRAPTYELCVSCVAAIEPENLGALTKLYRESGYAPASDIPGVDFASAWAPAS